MTLQKQAIDIPFASGLDTKTDPKRVDMGKFLSLENSIFDKGGLLQKRNGYRSLTALPDSSSSYLTTLNDNLTAVGTNINAYNAGDTSWVVKGKIQPLSIRTLPLLRNNYNQTLGDAAIASNGLICTVYLESSGTITTNKYVIADAATGQNIVAPTAITGAEAGTVDGGMRAFFLDPYFIIIFTNNVAGTDRLEYMSIDSRSPTATTLGHLDNFPISTTGLAWDAVVLGTNLYIANASTGTSTIVIQYLSNTLALSAQDTIPGDATLLSACADSVTSRIILCWYDGTTQCNFRVFNAAFSTVRTTTLFMNSFAPVSLTATAYNGTLTGFFERSNSYTSWSTTVIPTNSVSMSSASYAAGSPTALVVCIRSVGLASKGFLINGTSYFWGAFQSPYQPTYFLINGTSSTASSPVISAKLAYGNGGGYVTKGLPNVTVNGTVAQFPYLFKDLIAAVNKNTNVTAGTQTAGIYSQTGINLASLTFGTDGLDTAETANNLHLSGGFLWQYDGYLPVEHNFFLWTDTNAGATADVAAYTASAVTPTGTFSNASTTVTLSSATGVAVGMSISDTSNATYIPAGTIITALSGVTATISNATTHSGAGDNLSIHGFMAAKPDGSTTTNAYYYQFVYEWTDNAGFAYRSAPSIPVPVTTSGAASTGSIVLNIPTLRLTYKTSNPVKIVIYRWSVGQQIYYQTTSITSPLVNDTTVDMVTYVDVNSDATILGNNIIYTNGGVVEDVNAPASDILTLFDTRLWLVDAEDRNLLWFSKQVIESAPVEMSDLLTMFVPPTTGTQGSTGPIAALNVMDDKLIIFKGNAIYYVNGTGPDNTGSNNQYSQPIFITSLVGSDNQRSIVFTPAGLMFQSDKGIWLLSRGLEVSYIGAPVQGFTLGATVNSAVAIPETNQVRFTLDTGVTLMYDYFYGQWGSFVNVPAVSSCIYGGLHTYINSDGTVRQETVGSYLDGSSPVLMQFTTGPLRLDALQSYQRAYFFYLLGEFLSPHKLYVSIAYDYSTTPSQSVILTPPNYSTSYGAGASQSPYGQGSPYGGPGSLEEFRVFLSQQRCQAFSISVQEVYDGSYLTPGGAGLTLSGINVVCGFKSKFKPMPAAGSYG